MRRSAFVLFALALVALDAGCRRKDAAPAEPDAATAVLALLEAGRFDEAIARVGEASDAQSLYVLGRAWAGKAAAAPQPTPAPDSEVPAAGLYKLEELTALGLLERAVAQRPDHAGAQLALAELLAPHALAAVAAQRVAASKAGTPPPAAGPDASVERVLRVYGDAIQADPAGAQAADSLVRFATAAGRLDQADAAFQELLRRKREDADLLVRYGDFLAGPAANPESALAQYAQALIWRPDDEATRSKMAGIHLGAAATHVQRREYAAAESRLKEARRYGAAQDQAFAGKLQELEQAIREVRGR